MEPSDSAMQAPSKSPVVQRPPADHVTQYHAGVLKLDTVEFCPVCEGRRLRRRFDVRHITGDPLHSWASDEGFPVAPVMECQDCSFVFKGLRPSADYLHHHYAGSGEGYIERVAEENPLVREDYRVARKLVRKAFPKGGAMLDVGCASGYFLESLGNGWEKHGLEILHLAAQRARARGGINVHECGIASAGFTGQSFDVVCSFDVVEHLADPMSFLLEARRILKPSGWLLVGTGDSRSLAARMSGSRWTYLCIPEHLSFFNSPSFSKSLGKVGFSEIKFKRVHHGERNRHVAKAWLRAVGKHWAVSLCGEKVVRLKVFRQKTSEFLVPYFFDHMICIAH
jgi:SAM-dependent methyltransferase